MENPYEVAQREKVRLEAEADLFRERERERRDTALGQLAQGESLEREGAFGAAANLGSGMLTGFVGTAVVIGLVYMLRGVFGRRKPEAK